MMRLVMMVVCLAGLFSSSVFGEVLGWRMDHDGNYPDANPVLEWSDTENVIWKTELPSWSNASPVIVGERIFVCSEPNVLICLDKKSGKILWQQAAEAMDVLDEAEAEKVRAELKATEPLVKELKDLEGERFKLQRKARNKKDDPQIQAEMDEINRKIDSLFEQLEPLARYRLPRTHDVNGYSSPTPVCDGQFVYVVYGTGMVACYDVEGNLQWMRYFDARQSPSGWGHSTSPVLAGGRLLVHIQNLYALDPASGETVWEHEMKPKWGTPVVVKIDGVDVVLHPSGAILRGEDGHVLAKDVTSLEFNTPIVKDGRIYCIEGDARAYALPDKVGKTIEFEKLWETKIDKDRHYSSPVLYNGLIYDITRQQTITVLEADTGDLVYEKKINIESEGGTNRIYSSVTEAGGYIFFSGISGGTLVVKPGREFVELKLNQLEKFYSTPVFIGERMYIRGYDHMYCIGRDERKVLAD